MTGNNREFFERLLCNKITSASVLCNFCVLDSNFLAFAQSRLHMDPMESAKEASECLEAKSSVFRGRRSHGLRASPRAESKVVKDLILPFSVFENNFIEKVFSRFFRFMRL